MCVFCVANANQATLVKEAAAAFAAAKKFTKFILRSLAYFLDRSRTILKIGILTYLTDF